MFSGSNDTTFGGYSIRCDNVASFGPGDAPAAQPRDIASLVPAVAATVLGALSTSGVVFIYPETQPHLPAGSGGVLL